MSSQFRTLLPSLFRYTNPPINTPAIDKVDKTLILLAKEDHIKVNGFLFLFLFLFTHLRLSQREDDTVVG